MSMVPMYFRDWWDDNLDVPLRTSRLLEQHFGHEVATEDLVSALTTQLARTRPPGHNWPWRHSSAVSRPQVKTNDKFQINLDVHHFNPKEISVNVNERWVTVEGKHEEQQDEHGFVSRQFVRRYKLPEEHDADKVVSSLSSDGILTITATKKALPEPKGTRAVAIVQTGQPMGKLTDKSENGSKRK